MNIKQLEVFLAVAENNSFSKGAEATYLTQSTASQHIAALEAEFGIKLLDRTGRGALPTEAGKVLQRHGRQVVSAMADLQRAIGRFKGLEEADLKVGGSNIPGTYLIPALLPLLVQRYPGITLTILEGDSREILGKVATGEIEVGIVGSRFTETGLHFTPFGRDELRLMVAKDHRWSQRATIKPEELLDEPLLFREPGSGTGKTVGEALRGAGIDPARLRVKAYLGSNEAVKQAIVSMLGVSFVSEISVRKELARGELQGVPVEGVTMTRQFYLTSRQGRELSPAARAFTELLLSTHGAP